MCDAKFPEVYTLSGSTTILIPGNLSLFSLNSATASLGILSAIFKALVLLYPSVTIAYLIAIIFLTSSTLSCFISYLSLNL